MAPSRVPRGPCCARWASAMPTSASRRSGSPPPGPISRPATCISRTSPARQRRESMRPAPRACCSTPSRVSDGISMGSPGMRYSLVSREVIADSIETVVGAEGFDGFVAVGGCDKNMPGCAMAMARLNRPAVFVYGGTIRPGVQRRDIVSVFEAVGAHAAGRITDGDLLEVERTAIPGARQLRRDVHRQYHGLGHRSPRPVAARQFCPGGGEYGEAPGLRARRRRGGATGAVRAAAARHPDAPGLRKRHHAEHCPGRFHQCRPASAGHRP